MANVATLSAPTQCLDSLAPGPHLMGSAKMDKPKTCGSKSYAQGYGYEYKGEKHKSGLGSKFLVGLIVFIIAMLLSALILYIARPPLILMDIDYFVIPNKWPISNTKLWGWSALFALIIAIIAMIVA